MKALLSECDTLSFDTLLAAWLLESDILILMVDEVSVAEDSSINRLTIGTKNAPTFVRAKASLVSVLPTRRTMLRIKCLITELVIRFTWNERYPKLNNIFVRRIFSKSYWNSTHDHWLYRTGAWSLQSQPRVCSCKLTWMFSNNKESFKDYAAKKEFSFNLSLIFAFGFFLFVREFDIMLLQKFEDLVVEINLWGVDKEDLDGSSNSRSQKFRFFAFPVF